MGKVIINKTDPTKTAKNGSLTESRTGANRHKERAHVDVSRKAEKTDRVGVKVNTKTNSNKVPAATKVRALPAKIEQPARKAAASNIKVNNSDKATAEARSQSQASGKSPVKRSPRIARFAEPKTKKPAVLEKTTLNHRAAAPQKSAQSEMGLVVRERDIDPEIALMASRAKSMEHPKPEVLRSSASRSRQSMSGMVNDQRRTDNVGQRNADQPKSTRRDHIESKTADGEPALSKTKSMLVGVGVALVVAVIGFAGIGLFGNNKPMCVVHFESNGGSEVEGTEIVCGRIIERPADPVKEGFTFEGWILDGDPFDFDETSVYKDSTLVAKWKANEGTEVVLVKFDTDGGSTIKEVEIAKGKKLTRPSAPTKIGYVFEDWYLGDKVFDFDEPVNENITLKAKWERRSTSANDKDTANTDSRAKSVAITGDASLTVEVDKSVNMTIKVLPSTAKYSLTATTSDDKVATCNVNKNVITCTAKASGTAKVNVRDVNSGNSTQFTITVPDQTPPAVTDPDPEQPKPDTPTPDNPNPDKPVNPDPENPDQPDNPDPENPNPDNPNPENPDNPDPDDTKTETTDPPAGES